MSYLRRSVEHVRTHPYLYIFLLGMLVRAIYLRQAWTSNPLIDYPQADANSYVAWARRILDGVILDDFVSYAPAYPLYLAPFFAILRSADRIFLAFHLIGALNAVVIGKLAETVFSRKAGIVAALIAATYWPFILHEATFYAENFTVPVLTLAVLILLRGRGEPTLRFLLVGTLLVLAALTRLNILLPLAAYLVASLVVTWRTQDAVAVVSDAVFPRTTKQLLAVAAPTIVLVGSLLWWNYRATGIVMLRDQVALTTYVGNAPEYEGLVPRAGLEWRTLLFEPSAAGYTDQASQQEFWRQRTVETISSDPPAWLWLQVRKFLMNVNAFEVSQEIDIPYYRSHSGILNFPWPGAWLVVPLGLSGIVLFGLRDRRTMFLAGLGVLYFLAIMPSQVAARYRLPLIPILIVFGSMVLVAVFDQIRARHERTLIKPVVLVTLFALLCLPDYLSMRDRVLIHTEYQIGEKALAQGDEDTAISYFRLSLSRHADDYNSMFWLAQGRLFRDGDIGEPKALLTGLLDAKPTSPDAWWLLGEVHLAERDSVRAAAAARRALELAPNSEAAQGLAERLGVR